MGVAKAKAFYEPHHWAALGTDPNTSIEPLPKNHGVFVSDSVAGSLARNPSLFWNFGTEP